MTPTLDVPEPMGFPPVFRNGELGKSHALLVKLKDGELLPTRNTVP